MASSTATARQSGAQAYGAAVAAAAVALLLTWLVDDPMFEPNTLMRISSSKEKQTGEKVKQTSVCLLVQYHARRTTNERMCATRANGKLKFAGQFDARFLLLIRIKKANSQTGVNQRSNKS